MASPLSRLLATSQRATNGTCVEPHYSCDGGLLPKQSNPGKLCAGNYSCENGVQIRPGAGVHGAGHTPEGTIGLSRALAQTLLSSTFCAQPMGDTPSRKVGVGSCQNSPVDKRPSLLRTKRTFAAPAFLQIIMLQLPTPWRQSNNAWLLFCRSTL